MRLAFPIECVCARCLRPFQRWRRRGSMTQCSPCSNALRVSVWVKAHPERAKQHSGYGGTDEAKKRYAATERGMHIGREKALRHYRKHKHETIFRERLRAGCRQNYARHKDAFVLRATNRKKHVKRATPQWADRQAIADVYKQARHLSLETGITHEVDHLYPLRGRKVSGLHVEWNLRIISAADNRTKRNYMPEAMAL